MKINNLSFPYPVLGRGDDVYPILTEENTISAPVKEDKYNLYFDITYIHYNDDILQLINDGFAEYVCEIDCSRTFLKECYAQKNNKFIITIPRRRINGRVYIYGSIIVKKAIKSYRNNGFNEDYSGYSFDLEPGDVLAIFPTTSIDTDIKYDKLQATGSFMEIREDQHSEYVDYNIHSDKIAIILPKSQYDIYISGINHFYKSVIFASIVQNALFYALTCFEDVDKELLWVRCIQTRLETESKFEDFKNGFEKEYIPYLVQMLLSNPEKRMFDFLKNINEIGEE